VFARSGHAAFYVCLVTIGMALPPGILLGFLRGDPLQTLGYTAFACACSGLATGALAVGMRFLARCCGYARAALIAGTGKALLLGGGVAMFALGMQRLQLTADALPIGRLGAELLPPYHAARLLAHPDDLWRLLPFVGGACLLLLLGIAIGEAEAQRNSAAARTACSPPAAPARRQRAPPRASPSSSPCRCGAVRGSAPGCCRCSDCRRAWCS